jgi:hypothetical protein
MFEPGTTVYKAHVGQLIDHDGRLPAWIETATVTAGVLGGHQVVSRDGRLGVLAGDWQPTHDLAKRRLIEMLLDRANGLLDQLEELAPEESPPRTLDGLIDVMFGPIVVGQSPAGGCV